MCRAAPEWCSARGNADLDGAAAELLAIEFLDGSIRVLWERKGDEATALQQSQAPLTAGWAPDRA